VLIVEDEPAVRMIAKTILSRHGFNIYESENAVDALELWNHHRDEIDILFSDMVMPKNMTGIELAKKLTESKPSLRVVITSGYNVDMIEDNDDWLSQALFLPKPYSASDLVKIIKG
jgi:CheY-like chemotaxis protein